MTERELAGRYRPRRIRFLGLWEPYDWKIKVYGISTRDEGPAADLVESGKELALRQLPRPAVSGERYGLGLLMVHERADGNYVFVDWWVRETMISNHVFASPPGDTRPEAFRHVTPTGLSHSLWEIHVLHFERTAWITSVLDRDGPPDFEEYLTQRFVGEA